MCWCNTAPGVIRKCATFRPSRNRSTPEGRAALAFYISGAELGRSLVAPPGIPADRVKVLRAAFDAMLKDREFLAEIEKSGQEFYPASGEEVQKLIAATANAPRNVVELHGNDPAAK